MSAVVTNPMLPTQNIIQDPVPVLNFTESSVNQILLRLRSPPGQKNAMNVPQQQWEENDGTVRMYVYPDGGAQTLFVSGNQFSAFAAKLQGDDGTLVDPLICTNQTANPIFWVSPFSLGSLSSALSNGAVTCRSNLAGQIPLTVQGVSGQTAPTAIFVGSPTFNTNWRAFVMSPVVVSNASAAMLIYGADTGNTPQKLAEWHAEWIDRTAATYKGRAVLGAYDVNGFREGLRIDTNGSVPLLGFLGGAAVVKQTGASAAGIAAITDANARAAVSALQTALANFNLVTSPA